MTYFQSAVDVNGRPLDGNPGDRGFLVPADHDQQPALAFCVLSREIKEKKFEDRM